MPYSALLAAHAALGAAGLLLGPVVMYRDTRRLRAAGVGTDRVGALYRGVVALVCLTAVALVLLARRDLWWLVPVAALTLALAVLARISAGRGVAAWSHGYAHGQGGSYIALVTAFLVVSPAVGRLTDGATWWLPWLGPTVVGTALIEVWRRRLVRPPAVPAPPPAVDAGRGGLRTGRFR